MDRFDSVDRDLHPAGQPAASSPNPAPANSNSWSSPESQPALLDLMHDLLGSESEPDPLFFVETWTRGIDAATESFHARQPISPTQDAAPSAHRAFDFAVPLIFVYDQSDFPSTGYSAAWKEAYGVKPPASAHTKTAHNEATPSTPAPNQPLTCDDACRMLGIAPASTRKQIKDAYRQLARRYHPDRQIHSTEQERRIATDRMTSINAAYHLLCGSTPGSI